MILESFNSFIDNIKTKVSNPFFGTLIAVWLIRNWKLVYGLFIFDKDCKMEDKFQFVKNHFNNKDVFYEIWTNVIITFGLLLLGYLLLIISRFLANLVEHRITPNINRIAASKLVANREILEELETQLLKKTNDLINERKLVNELELQLVEIRGRVDVATNEKNSASSKLFEQTKQNREIKSNNEILENKNKNLVEDLKVSRDMSSDVRRLAYLCQKINDEKKISFKHIDCYLDLWNFNLVESFSDMISQFDSGSKKYKNNEFNVSLQKILSNHKMSTASYSTDDRTTTMTYTELGEEFASVFNKLKKELNSFQLLW